MTEIVFDLSSTGLRNTLGQQGVLAYAVYFEDGNTTPGQTTTTVHWTTLVDGTVTSAAGVPNQVTITDLPNTYKGGKIYILIQSASGSPPYPHPNTFITQESDINWGSATTNNYRYDSFELTLTPSKNDQGNLTSVNGWGLPMEVTVEYQDGTPTTTRGYNQTGDWMWGTGGGTATGIKAIDADLIYKYTAGPLNGLPRMAASPTEAVGSSLPGFAAADWNNYIQSLEVTNPGITIAGYFNGAPDANNVWHNGGFYSYDLKWDGTNFWLNAGTNSQVKGSIQITPTDLANSIYSTLGNVDIYTSQGGTLFLDNMNSGANNQWGAVLAQFLTGFTAGYYGGTGNPLNAAAPGTVNLDKSWNWDPTYAFGNDHATTSASVFYDKYARLFFNETNSYGSGYSDNLMKAFTQGGPLVPIANTSGASAGQDVDKITIKLLGDSDAASGGYLTPKIANYVAPPSGQSYTTKNDHTSVDLNIVMNFNTGQVVLTDQTPITLGFYTGTTGGVATFNTVGFPPGQTLFQNWNLLFDAGTGTYSLTPYIPAVQQPPGSILVNQWPVSPALSGGSPVDGGVNWYQVTVGSGTAAKTFNMYLTSDSSGNVYNPAYTGQSDFAGIDGLAAIAPPANAGQLMDPTFSVNFFNGGAVTINSSLLSQVTEQTAQPNVHTGATYIDTTPNAAPWTVPTAIAVGTVATSGGTTTFTQAAAPGAAIPTLTSGGVAFGWTGADAAWVAQQAALATPNYVVKDLTNKVGALNWARVQLTSGTNPTIVVPVQADLDGAWFTSTNAQLGNGVWSATMQEYAAQSGGYGLNKVSTSVSFTVNAPTLQIEGTGGNYISVDQGGTSAGGNWIRLETQGSSLHNGTLIAYATDSLGNMVGRDGETGSGVTLSEATLARIGQVASDSGSTLFSGGQSVYLGVGQQLHFAIQTGDGNVEQLTNVVITGTSSLAVNVSGSFGALQLLATVNNTLSGNASLAAAQRTYDTPWAFLSSGQTVNVQVAGSAANTNTVHFVLFDVDSSTGAWSVGGVAYGNTGAFRSAVQSNWVDGFAAQAGGGTFFSSANWTVTGTSGFYAPVLATGGGDIFVIGTANVDGREHIRTFGENVFGFEDLRADQRSDFDYNDMIVKLTTS